MCNNIYLVVDIVLGTGVKYRQAFCDFDKADRECFGG
jgi:hypothetical protein